MTRTQPQPIFTTANNGRTLRSDEWRIWAHGTSAIVRSSQRASIVAARAGWWASDVSIEQPQPLAEVST